MEHGFIVLAYMYQDRNITGDIKTEGASICMTNTLAQSHKGRNIISASC